jgi:hypothetical protein
MIYKIGLSFSNQQHILGRRMDIMFPKTRTCDTRGEDAIHEFGEPRV